ncbi:MAG: peptidase [Acidobacteria bacterium]|nr:peptidase [Acidobacteriota bacterium]
MKRYSLLLAIAVGILLSGSLMTATAASLRAANGQDVEANKKAEQDKLQRQAKITLEQARETALKRAPGTVEEGELEREHGKLVYSFDIRNARGTITEIQVSAITGKVVRVEHESKAQEAAEKRKDAKKKP